MMSTLSECLATVLRRLSSEHSRRAYQTAWARYTAWLKVQKVAVLEARPRHVEDHLAELQEKNYEKATIGHALSIVREVYAACVRRELIETNPAREIKPPRMDAHPKTPLLTQEQVKTLFSLPTKTWRERRDRVCVELLFGLGLRRAEVARLQGSNFRQKIARDVLVKGNKRITIAVPAWLWKSIEDWRQYAGITDGPLLPRGEDDKNALSGDMVYQVVVATAKRAGLPHFSPHALRRSNITLAGELGVPLRARQLAVGHTSGQTTEQYDHARDATKVAPGDVFADLVKGDG